MAMPAALPLSTTRDNPASLAVSGPSVSLLPSLSMASSDGVRSVKIGADRRAGSHLVVLDSGRQSVADDDRFEALRAVVAGARSGAIGAEGFSTAMVLGRVDLDKVTGIESSSAAKRPALATAASDQQQQ